MKKKHKYDFLLVGAGLFNAVFAWHAKQHDKRCLVIDKRKHLGGNIYCEDIEGIHVHRYGPHIFHTNNNNVWDFVNRFVTFNRFTLCPVANNSGRIYNLPFNMNTFHQLWGVVTPAEAVAKIKEQTSIYADHEPSNLEEQALSVVGHDIYETLIKGYTEKQWGRPCTELPASIIRRLPIRFTYDNNYFNDRYQGVPEGGYNLLIDGLLKDVECRTCCNYFDDKSFFDDLANQIVYTGPIDQYFDYRFGQLEYRSLRFEDEILLTDNYQGNAMVNYPLIQVPYTRIVEHKHFDINNTSLCKTQVTVLTKEYSLISKYDRNNNPFYPIEDQYNNNILKEYQQIAKLSKSTLFGGRLGMYKYMDMSDVIEVSIEMFNNTLNHYEQ